MVLEILRQVFSCVQTSLQFGVCYVACHDDCAVEAEACGYRILAQFLAHFAHRTVEVYLHGVAFSCLAQLLRYEFAWIVVQFLNPYSVLVYLSLYVAVG